MGAPEPAGWLISPGDPEQSAFSPAGDRKGVNSRQLLGAGTGHPLLIAAPMFAVWFAASDSAVTHQTAKCTANKPTDWLQRGLREVFERPSIFLFPFRYFGLSFVPGNGVANSFPDGFTASHLNGEDQSCIPNRKQQQQQQQWDSMAPLPKAQRCTSDDTSCRDRLLLHLLRHITFPSGTSQRKCTGLQRGVNVVLQLGPDSPDPWHWERLHPTKGTQRRSHSSESYCTCTGLLWDQKTVQSHKAWKADKEGRVCVCVCKRHRHKHTGRIWITNNSNCEPYCGCEAGNTSHFSWIGIYLTRRISKTKFQIGTCPVCCLFIRLFLPSLTRALLFLHLNNCLFTSTQRPPHYGGRSRNRE